MRSVRVLRTIVALAAIATTAAESQEAVALVGVNVVPVRRAGVLRDQTLVVRDGRIAAIGPRTRTPVPADAQAIDAAGLYVMPGLVDMHVHIFDAAELPFYVESGITTVRNMWGWDLHLRLREQVERGELVGPFIVTTGELLDGDPPQLRGSAVVRTAVDADSIVARMAAQGFDAVKVYNGLSPEAYGAIVAAANRHRLPVVGHVPTAVGMTGVLAARQASLEHLWGVPRAVAIPDSSPITWASRLDDESIARLASQIRMAGSAVVPTLVARQQAELSAAETRSLIDDPRVARLPSGLRRFCCSRAGDSTTDLSAAERELRRTNRFRVIRALAREGVPLLVGTDTGNPFVIPGVSYHDELALLEAAGLSRCQILRAATLAAAELLRLDTEIGAIASGLRADLLIVRGNPLEDLSVLRHPDGVMIRGRWAVRSSRLAVGLLIDGDPFLRAR